jgi:hypothetical protein
MYELLKCMGSPLLLPNGWAVLEVCDDDDDDDENVHCIQRNQRSVWEAAQLSART